MNSLYERLDRLASERERLAQEEANLREEGLKELVRVNEEIEALEVRKEQLESLLGLDVGGQRAAHGQIQQLCLEAVSSGSEPMTSSQIRDYLEMRYPGMKLTSVPATLSRMMMNGKLQRDERGRYLLA